MTPTPGGFSITNPSLVVHLRVSPHGTPIYRALVTLSSTPAGCAALADTFFTGETRREISEQIRAAAAHCGIPNARLVVIDV